MRIGILRNLNHVRMYLSPGGAILTLVCFFLPWVKLSFGPGIERRISGAGMGGIVWVVFIAALGILGSFIFFKSRNRVQQARPIIAVCSIAALAVILVKYLASRNGTSTELVRIRPEDVGASIGPGGVGTLVGLALSLAGSALIGGGPGGCNPTGNEAQASEDRSCL
jgi:hypothetical protein